MDIITGKTGAPHVTSQQDREINQAIFGKGNAVLNIGTCFAYENMGSNVIRIKDGLLMIQGTGASIPRGSFEDVTIENGTQGKTRTDTICAVYRKNSETGIESVNLEVSKGVALASNPLAMELLNLVLIRNGGLTALFPLYEVTLDGVTITEIKPVFEFANEKRILYSGNQQMGAGAEIELSESLSKQKTGIVLVWALDGSDRIENIYYKFIPKEAVSLFGETTHTIFLCTTNFTKTACKSVIVKDDCILGNQYNMAEGQHNGIIFNNADYTLRYVLGY